MVDEEVRVVVARAHILDAPKIDVVAPKEIRVRRNKPLRLQYLFRVEEASRAKEAWRFQLASNVGSQTREPVSSNWEDRWGLKDEFWGTLEQTFKFAETGTFTAGFRVDAEYDRAAWRGKTEAVAARKQVNGNFIVRVDP